MQQSKLKLSSLGVLAVWFAAGLPVGAQSEPAARVDFAVGDVAAVNKAGQSRPLAKGAQVEEGETINTHSGRAQLRFTDGAYVSLQPQSEFRIDQYRYEGREDGSEKTFLSLLKGGLRTITGFVGRTNKKNYQVSTTVATIGIRGTEYTIQYGESIRGTVGEGEIEVCNGAGCLNVANGESYYVANQDVKPQLTNKGTDLPPAPTESPPSDLQVGENIDLTGFPAIFALIGAQSLDVGEVNLGARSDLISQNVPMVFDEDGALVSFNGQPVTSVRMNGNDGIMAWGTFTDFSTPALLSHFVAGLPVPSSDLSNLGGTLGTYIFINSTPVTDPLNNPIGTLDSATLTVNFGSVAPASANASMEWTINAAPLSASLIALPSLFPTSLSGAGTCGLSCSVVANILLFGPNAMRAGMIYEILNPSIKLSGIGSAAFAK